MKRTTIGMLFIQLVIYFFVIVSQLSDRGLCLAHCMVLVLFIKDVRWLALVYILVITLVALEKPFNLVIQRAEARVMVSGVHDYCYDQKHML